MTVDVWGHGELDVRRDVMGGRIAEDEGQRIVLSGQDEKVFLAFKVFLAVAFSCHDGLVGGDGEEIAAVGWKFFLPLEAERGGIASDFIGDGVVFHTQRCFIAVKIDDGGFSCDAEENDHGVFLCAVEIPGRDEQVAVCGAEGEGVYVRAEIHLGEERGLCVERGQRIVGGVGAFRIEIACDEPEIMFAVSSVIAVVSQIIPVVSDGAFRPAVEEFLEEGDGLEMFAAVR